MDYGFLIGSDELALAFRSPVSAPKLAFDRCGSGFGEWVIPARNKLTELLGVAEPSVTSVQELRTTTDHGVHITALKMTINPNLSLPAYLLHPEGQPPSSRVVLALHGHGEVATSLQVDGVTEDYHHGFAYRLAQAGHTVLLPELRGFGALFDLAAHTARPGLNYWRWGQPMAYTLQTDAFIHGRTLMGDTITDLRCWEAWLHANDPDVSIDVVGISWGGDLACAYPVFSNRVRSIFASGTLGSFEPVFADGGNAPAHCIPGVLQWLDRADIAGMNAPTPIMLHYGALDTPSPTNPSAAYNDSVPESITRLREIYAAAGAGENVDLHVSEGRHHELDIAAILTWLDKSDSAEGLA